MPILKLWKQEEKITLDDLCLKDITDDTKTSWINKDSFIQEQFRIDDEVYMVQNDLFFQASKLFTTETIHAMWIKHGKNHIIVIPSRSYVFWNGRSVDVEKYDVRGGLDLIRTLIKVR